MIRSVVFCLCLTACFGAIPNILAQEIHSPNEMDNIPRVGKPDPRLAPFDKLMRSFLKEHKIPGASLAVIRDDRLVYSAGFGWAVKPDDEKGLAGEPMRPQTLLRIASLSKPVTAMAIVKLAEGGKLRLDDPVLKHIGQKPLNGEKMDPRWEKITLTHLLHHSAGFDRGKSFDPMFRSVAFAEHAKSPPPATTDIVIRNMLGKPLDFDPGERYAYSNFGYCVLGRVIEKVTGETYEAAVKRLVLVPMGAKTMKMGRSLAVERYPTESAYYDSENRKQKSVFPPFDLVPRAYGSWYQESLDAHGGWIASAEEMARFARIMDQPGEEGRLSKASIAAIHSRPAEIPVKKEEKPPAVWYGLGYQVREVSPGKFNAWHTGLLPGSSALLVRRHDGLIWCVLFNSHGESFNKAAATIIDPLIHKAAAEVKEWPQTGEVPSGTGAVDSGF